MNKQMYGVFDQIADKHIHDNEAEVIYQFVNKTKLGTIDPITILRYQMLDHIDTVTKNV